MFMSLFNIYIYIIMCLITGFYYKLLKHDIAYFLSVFQLFVSSHIMQLCDLVKSKVQSPDFLEKLGSVHASISHCTHGMLSM